MCGFVGFLNENADADFNNKTVRAMADRIVHRGPDMDDYYVDDDVSLGFRRLSIIDLEGGSQPIYNEDKSKVLVFNGEIYNFRALREDLLAKGHKFYTHTDSEVLIHGYEEYGKDLLPKLRGMFVFVIWDKVEKSSSVQEIFSVSSPSSTISRETPSCSAQKSRRSFQTPILRRSLIRKESPNISVLSIFLQMRLFSEMSTSFHLLHILSGKTVK